MAQVNYRKILASLALAVALGLFLQVKVTQAARYTLPVNPPTSNTSSDNAPISKIVTSVVNVLLFGGGAAAAIYLVYGGVMYVTAGGDDTKTGNARKMIIGAVVGIILTGSVWLIFSASISAGQKFNTTGVTNEEL